jgi:hypothetical protein
MHKRKYTKEQLEFYFKKLMDKIKKIPREEDMAHAKGMPSVQAYVDRFGSWEKAVEMFANFDLAKRKCLNCSKILIRRMKTQKFCSDKCANLHRTRKLTKYTKNTEKKLIELLGNKCFICDFEKIVEIHSLDNKKESKTKILRSHGRKDMTDYILLCPNHHLMVHRKLARTNHKNGEIVWEEIIYD